MPLETTTANRHRVESSAVSRQVTLRGGLRCLLGISLQSGVKVLPFLAPARTRHASRFLWASSLVLGRLLETPNRSPIRVAPHLS
jgi:hypothetical protein